VKRSDRPIYQTYDFTLPDDVVDFIRHGTQFAHAIASEDVSADGLKYGLCLIEGRRPTWVIACHVRLPRKRRGAIPRSVREAVRKRDGNACRQCGSKADIQLDHIKPWCRGGTDTVENLQCLCGLCNRRKWHVDRGIA
jgi:hypothetical protein